jgi:hypothetical protein
MINWLKVSKKSRCILLNDKQEKRERKADNAKNVNKWVSDWLKVAVKKKFNNEEKLLDMGNKVMIW